MCAGYLNMSHFNFQGEIITKYRLCAFLKSTNYPFLFVKLVKLEYFFTFDSNALSYAPNTNLEVDELGIETWAIFAFNGKMTNKYTTLRFNFRDYFRFFVLKLFMRKNMAHWDSNALSNVPNRHLEVTFLCTWTQAILASTLKNGKKNQKSPTLTQYY